MDHLFCKNFVPSNKAIDKDELKTRKDTVKVISA